MFNQQPKGYKMGLKQWIRNWLGINQPDSKRYARVQQHAIGVRYVPDDYNNTKLIFWGKPKRPNCKNAKEFYSYLGGYEIMDRILQQELWWGFRKFGGRETRLCIFDFDNTKKYKTSGERPRERTMRCATPYKANLLAADILKIHNTERKRRGLEPIQSKQPIAFLTN